MQIQFPHCFTQLEVSASISNSRVRMGFFLSVDSYLLDCFERWEIKLENSSAMVFMSFINSFVLNIYVKDKTDLSSTTTEHEDFELIYIYIYPCNYIYPSFHILCY